ncbi:protein shifted-like [Portunus trituberculatus]|uniref:protein shifted-like n=1 Tax=Portunus trituberculatus TaxID=210409 RepID=UPI001E1CD3C5|nr:protein shifted-like [Portunus trituberculatus]XP_045102807.1 protein shifted-like [Portunus trituberculatus]
MRQRGRRKIKNLSLWLDQNQVKMFSGYLMEIFVIHDGRILPYILDPNFEKQLPVIPAQVENVTFTWSAGNKKYRYTFDQLQSQEEALLQVPTLSIAPHGTVPRRPQVFSVDMRCTGNLSGIATFSIGLLIHTQKKELLPGMPLRLRLRKECRQQGPDPECDQKCQNGGVCDASQQCQCPEGYMGQYCDTALCYPQCLNGGSCTTPGRCSCPPGFQGRHCEGGICQTKCKNGGKCIQKDRCKCRRGFFGNWCQYSQCFVACINGGKCRGVNKCRCPLGFAGDHCEVVLVQGRPPRQPHRCRRRCRHGTCHGGVSMPPRLLREVVP